MRKHIKRHKFCTGTRIERKLLLPIHQFTLVRKWEANAKRDERKKSILLSYPYMHAPMWHPCTSMYTLSSVYTHSSAHTSANLWESAHWALTARCIHTSAENAKWKYQWSTYTHTRTLLHMKASRISNRVLCVCRKFSQTFRLWSISFVCMSVIFASTYIWWWWAKERKKQRFHCVFLAAKR